MASTAVYNASSELIDKTGRRQQDAAVTDEDVPDIQQCLAGDGEAYGRIIKRHERAIAMQMWRFSHESSVCEELVQDVFVEAYFSLGRYKPLAPFEHWLRRIASRVGYQHWKKLARQPRQVQLEDWELLTQPPPPGRPPTPEEAEKAVSALLARLNTEDRMVLTLMYLEGCSVREIAERMGWNIAIVKMRAHRARKKLRHMLEKEGWAEKLPWTL